MYMISRYHARPIMASSLQMDFSPTCHVLTSYFNMLVMSPAGAVLYENSWKGCIRSMRLHDRYNTTMQSMLFYNAFRNAQCNPHDASSHHAIPQCNSPYDAICTMQSARCNPQDAIRTMQSARCNPQDAIRTM